MLRLLSKPIDDALQGIARLPVRGRSRPSRNQNRLRRCVENQDLARETLSNIKWRYLGESGPYVRVSPRNIGHHGVSFRYDFSDIVRYWHWTENPRVGGSIPPLATINFIIFQ
jgi:hypothetical protein